MPLLHNHLMDLCSYVRKNILLAAKGGCIYNSATALRIKKSINYTEVCIQVKAPRPKQGLAHSVPCMLLAGWGHRHGWKSYKTALGHVPLQTAGQVQLVCVHFRRMEEWKGGKGISAMQANKSIANLAFW